MRDYRRPPCFAYGYLLKYNSHWVQIFITLSVILQEHKTVTEAAMENSPHKEEGLRERKRRETLRRIAEEGLKLFLTKGYEATTLDEIAEAAGISRRTFFYYFKSKEDILMAWQGGGFTETVQAAVLEQSTKQSPLDAVKNALLELMSRYQPDPRQAKALDNLMCSTEVSSRQTPGEVRRGGTSRVRGALQNVAAAKAAACASRCRDDVDRCISPRHRQLDPRRRQAPPARIS